MADNACYTPTPQTIPVTVYEDLDSDNPISVSSGAPWLLRDQGYEIIGRENAKVVLRGNLLRNGTERWYQVELRDGSRHMVIGEGS